MLLRFGLLLTQESNVQALEILFTYHGADLLPHRLAILSNFPETTSLHEYAALLPEARYMTPFHHILPSSEAIEPFCFMLNTLNLNKQ